MMLAPLLLAAALPTATPQPFIVDQGRADRTQAEPLPQSEIDKAAPMAPVLRRVDATGSDRPITRIRFAGDKVPPPVAAAAQTFIGKPAHHKTLEQLAAALSAAYHDSDVALYTVAVPDQDLSQGTVVIQIAQGFIEDIVYPQGSSPLIRAYADKLRSLRPLTRSALERELSLMRDIAGAKIDADLLRGKQPGGVVLSLVIRRRKIEPTIGYDNTRSLLLGTGMFNVGVTANSVIRDGDETRATVQIARDLHSFVYGSVTHSTPLGDDGAKLNVSGGYLRTRVDKYHLDGKAVVAGVSVSYPVVRSYRKNLTVSAGVDMINSDSAVFGTVFSQDHIRTARLAVGYSQAGPKTLVQGGVTVSKGLDIASAMGTQGFSDPTFTKVNATAGYNHTIGKKVLVVLKGQAQYSADDLPATERMAAGGTEYGRAFSSAAVTGDSGVAAALEVQVFPSLGKKLKGTNLYLFVDHSKIHINTRITAPASTWDLGSAGGGVRIAYGDFGAVSVEVAKAIEDPFNGVLGDWQINLSWKVNMPRR